MDEARDEVLADPAFAGDQHLGVAGSDTRGGRSQPVHGRAASDEGGFVDRVVVCGHQNVLGEGAPTATSAATPRSESGDVGPRVRNSTAMR